MTNKYRNLWFKSCNIPRPEFYQNDAPKVLEHRGVEVFKLWETSFDFVIGGACITQRAGASKAKAVIDEILDGKSCVSEEVKTHLVSLGFKAYSYSDYKADYIAGRAA